MEMKSRLHNLAIKKSNPFCYTCYKRVSGSHCSSCGSDDLMRELVGVGVEYGTDWIISILVDQNLTEIDQDKLIQDTLHESYGDEVKIGPCTFDPVDVIKTMDPTFYRIALSDYLSSLEGDDEIISFDGGSTYYWSRDLESFLDNEGV